MWNGSEKQQEEIKYLAKKKQRTYESREDTITQPTGEIVFLNGVNQVDHSSSFLTSNSLIVDDKNSQNATSCLWWRRYMVIRCLDIWRASRNNRKKVNTWQRKTLYGIKNNTVMQTTVVSLLKLYKLSKCKSGRRFQWYFEVSSAV